MADNERCPLFPSIQKRYCSHCQGTRRGTPGNPKFSIRESYYNGFPIVEILRDGGPIHPFDSNFQFGIRKAQLLLTCIDVLREFWMSTEEERQVFTARVVDDTKRGQRVVVGIVSHEDFEYSTGEIVQRPWLQLQSLYPDDERIGVGMMKSRAVCALKSDLESWIRKYVAW